MMRNEMKTEIVLFVLFLAVILILTAKSGIYLMQHEKPHEGDVFSTQDIWTYDENKNEFLGGVVVSFMIVSIIALIGLYEENF